MAEFASVEAAGPEPAPQAPESLEASQPGPLAGWSSSLSPQTFLQLQRHVGNQHLSRLARQLPPRSRGLQRQPQVDDVPRPGDKVVPDTSPGMAPLPTSGDEPGGGELYTLIAVEIAAAKYDNPLHKTLVRHYAYGGGAPFGLSVEDMGHVLAPGSKRLNLLGGEVRLLKDRMDSLAQELPQVCDPQGRGSVSADVTDQAVIGCDSDKPSLGAFTCFVQGRLTATATGDEGVTHEFSGTMRWFDVWDFDPHLKATAEQEATAEVERRTPDAERGVRLAHDYLPGTPFNVDSPDVPLTQKTGEPAQW